MVEDLVKLFRTREDVRSMLPESLISELKSDLYSPIQPSSNAHEVQRASAKRPKNNLHCRACQNKFSSVEALENHIKKKTVNTGIQTILPRSFKCFERENKNISENFFNLALTLWKDSLFVHKNS